MCRLELFLLVLCADMLALLVFMVIKDSVEKHVTIFETWNNTKLYNLSFIYARAKELRGQGLTDAAICDKLQQEYNNNSLSIFQYPPRIPNKRMSKRKLKKYEARLEEYNKALEFIGQVISDKNLLNKYVIHSNFGKESFLQLTKELNANDNECAARQALKCCLIDESESNVDKVMAWFPLLFINPVDCPNEQNDKMGKIENSAAVYYALTSTSTVLKNGLSLRAYVNCLNKLQTIFPLMKNAKSPGDISKYSNKVQTSSYWSDWKDAIIEKVKKLHNIK